MNGLNLKSTGSEQVDASPITPRISRETLLHTVAWNRLCEANGKLIIFQSRLTRNCFTILTPDVLEQP
jgi:hypothetical protein